MSRTLRYGLLIALALGGVLLFLLASASSNTHAFERNYPLLLAINGAIALALLGLVIVLIARLVRRWRLRRFGARLMARFALAFAVIGIAPGLLIYFVSVQFLSRSIESWFDVRVDRALESGLGLGRAALEAQLADVSSKARSMALELADAPNDNPVPQLDRLRERAGLHEALLLNARGQVMSASAARIDGVVTELIPELPSTAQLRQARTQRIFAAIEGDPLASDARNGLRTRVLVPLPQNVQSPQGIAANVGRFLSPPPPPPEQRYLQLIQRVPPTVAANAAALQSGYRDYQELSLSRTGLRKIYTLTLTLTLLLAAFAAIASAVLLASSMAAPLLHVAAGTKAVAEGDFRPVREFRGNDELKLLTQSFNAMTRQLAEARDAVEKRSRELENARAYLERLLTNLSAGVLVLDQDYRLVTANFGASRILGLPLAPRIGELLSDVLPRLAEPIAAAFADQRLAATPKDSWQQQMQVPRANAAPDAEPLALLARGSRLPLDNGPGYVVVFDDITQVISAQRAMAWGEVARRLAHEIKNPLTPIQLAAERLQMKLSPKLPEDQAAVLVRGATTIVNQVAAMKRMVDDFRDYARVPPAHLAPLDLNALLEEIAALYGAGFETNTDAKASGAKTGESTSRSEITSGSETTSGEDASAVRIELQLASDLPRIEADPTQLRQVIHNLLTNAQDALSSRSAERRSEPGRITVRTEPVWAEDGKATERRTRAVRLTIEDNGAGFPPNILRRAFEPYVTTKPSGTGLGLAMVKKIVDEHGARIELVNRHLSEGGGALVIVVFRRLAALESAAAAAAADASSTANRHAA